MAPLEASPAAARRSVASLALALLVSTLTRAASADHGVPASGRPGPGWTLWLLIAGAVAAVGLAAWAFFAPDRREDAARPTPPDGAGPEPPSP
jgi:hypothetical protein